MRLWTPTRAHGPPLWESAETWVGRTGREKRLHAPAGSAKGERDERRCRALNLLSLSILIFIRDKRRTLHGGLVPVDPMTPDIHAPCSKRAFDGQVRKWRRMLHAWDPEEGAGGQVAPVVLGGEGGAEGTAEGADADDADLPGASPGTKRGASARTPATAGRRKQGRTAGGRGGGSGSTAAQEKATTPAAAAAAGKSIFDGFEETEDWTLVSKPAAE